MDDVEDHHTPDFAVQQRREMTMFFPPPYDPADQVAELRLAAMPTAVPWARRHTRQQLRKWHLEEFADDLLLAVSEIVTNSVKATGTLEAPTSYTELYDQHLATVLLRLRLTASGLYAEVWDRADESPMPQQASVLDEGGRGLALVAALCDDWGFYSSRHGGKVTWCAIKVPSPPPDVVAPLGHEPDPFPSDHRPPTDAETVRRVLDGLSEIRNVLYQTGTPDPYEPSDQLLETAMR